MASPTAQASFGFASPETLRKLGIDPSKFQPQPALGGVQGISGPAQPPSLSAPIAFGGAAPIAAGQPAAPGQPFFGTDETTKRKLMGMM